MQTNNKSILSPQTNNRNVELNKRIINENYDIQILTETNLEEFQNTQEQKE
jgi:hypothetical protein